MLSPSATGDWFSRSGSEIAAAVAFVVGFAILINVLQQILFKEPHKPPVVFHLLPFIGSTVTYGMDPFKFFFHCQAKVRIFGCFLRWLLDVTVLIQRI